ncbi:MAG: hypothetical protein QSU88_07840, partial [Candidatus Methanoperedens sp.]|nr:hypothetical protein [Candidatus Methanoperedens sp.]
VMGRDQVSANVIGIRPSICTAGTTGINDRQGLSIESRCSGTLRSFSPSSSRVPRSTREKDQTTGHLKQTLKKNELDGVVSARVKIPPCGAAPA